jgi:hypothetical protein
LGSEQAVLSMAANASGMLTSHLQYGYCKPAILQVIVLFASQQEKAMTVPKTCGVQLKPPMLDISIRPR